MKFDKDTSVPKAEFTWKDLQALKILLGKITHGQMKLVGLNSKQAHLITDMYIRIQSFVLRGFVEAMDRREDKEGDDGNTELDQ